MVRTMSAREARNKFAELLGIVYYSKEPVIVEKKGRPFAVLVSVEDFQRMQQEREERFRLLGQIREKNVDKIPEEVERDVMAAVEAVRQATYEGKERKTTRRR
ncbi:MAG: type II toxin-antitoxin system Phd/YefM family antitoxin [Chloroflexi bacterium]|nr:type II toxin-antitoxin system Phd/YefM family antitoxin [Chloroflexota bacterium]